MNPVGFTLVALIIAAVGGFMGFLFGLKFAYDHIIPTWENDCTELRKKNKYLREYIDKLREDAEG